MKKYFLIAFILNISIVYGQDNSFKFIEKFTGEVRAKNISDSFKLPILITQNNIYSIGYLCVSKLIDGDYDERNNSGNVDDRNKDGNVSVRNKGGAVENRKNSGETEKRKNGGDIDSRKLEGSVSKLPYCSKDNKGKLIFYTNQEIVLKKSKIYFEGNYFNYKYFKIEKL